MRGVFGSGEVVFWEGEAESLRPQGLAAPQPGAGGALAARHWGRSGQQPVLHSLRL